MLYGHTEGSGVSVELPFGVIIGSWVSANKSLDLLKYWMRCDSANLAQVQLGAHQK